MPEYRVNRAAVAQAQKLIDDGTYDDDTAWSDVAPDAAAANAFIEAEGFGAFAAWHLAEDPDASEGTKGRYAFPYGDFRTVNRAALIHARQRASQNDHDTVEEVAADLLQRLDAHRQG
ncbi:hypothetical protein [Geodermatophilus sp. SYSU D01176]